MSLPIESFDFTMVPPYVVFGVSMNTSNLVIPLVNDDTTEPDEVFSVMLSPITPNVIIGNNGVINVTIIDDDSKLTGSVCTYVHTYYMYVVFIILTKCLNYIK